jgi:ribosome recycling factor
VKAKSAVRSAKRSVRKVARSARRKVRAVKREARSAIRSTAKNVRSATRTVEKAADQFVSATAAKVEKAAVAVDQTLAEARPIPAAPPAQAA